MILSEAIVAQNPPNRIVNAGGRSMCIGAGPLTVMPLRPVYGVVRQDI